MAVSERIIHDTSPLVERFLRHKLLIQGRSQKTVDEYRMDLHLFFVYLISTREGRKPSDEDFYEISTAGVDEAFVRSITTLEILEFLMFTASERKNAASARSRKLSAIKAFFKYLSTVEHMLDKNPAADIEGPKKKKALPKSLSEKESIDLLGSVLDDKDSGSRERDFCILTLFLNCGMRLSELVGINLADIDRELRSMRVVGKGNKERIIYLNDACREALLSYLSIRVREQDEAKDKNALFLSRFHQRISNKTVQWMVYKYLNAAGLQYKHFSTHKLRHTAATLMYQEGGVDVLTLKEILGHEQLSTTQIYTHVGDRSREEAIQKNPLAHMGRKALEKRGHGKGGADEEKDEIE